MSLIITFLRILSLLTHLFVSNQGTSSLVGSDQINRSLPPEHLEALSHTRVAAKPGEAGARDLAGSWCSAYKRSDPERLAALETREMEIVDRFGDWHHLIGFKARAQFWKDGFDLTNRKHFRPKCFIQHVRLIGLNAAMAQVTVSYDEGIALADGNRIPPFSEIHTLVLANVAGRWLITAEDIVQQNSSR